MTSRNLARTTGLLYALNIAIGILAIVWTSRDKPTADLLNLAGAAEYAIVVILLGRLFEPAARGLSWVVAGIGLIACAVSAAMILHLVAAPPGVNPVVGGRGRQEHRRIAGIGLDMLIGRIGGKPLGVFRL